ncbi:MAG: hypothetical protein ABIF10_06290 [Candidatus Woesearchaeota archaeon]
MSYRLLIKKLLMDNNKFVTREQLKGYCNTLGMSYDSAIGYLLSNDYLTRVLRGVFYIKNVEERKNKAFDVTFFQAVTEALRIKKITNWYFGLESAIKLNGLTHEYFAVDFIISDKLKRPRPIEILGRKVKFLKIKNELTQFGIRKAEIPYSDIEKTVLDMAFLGIYNGLSETEIRSRISDYAKYCSKPKMLKYSKHYPKTVSRFVQ